MIRECLIPKSFLYGFNYFTCEQLSFEKLLCLCCRISDFFKFVQSSKKYDSAELTGAFKVLSFNVRDFDIYNYGKHSSLVHVILGMVFLQITAGGGKIYTNKVDQEINIIITSIWL